MSAITSPYFTDELAAFLKEKGVLELAEQRCLPRHGKTDTLVNAFIFILTKEGHRFWSDLEKEYQNSRLL